MSPTFIEIVIATVAVLALLYGWMARQDYLFGRRQRRLNRFKGCGWSRWAEMGWKAEDKRRSGLQ